MDKSKGVRKYGRVVQGLRWVRYIAYAISILGFIPVWLHSFGVISYMILILVCHIIVVAAGRVLIHLGYSSAVGDLYKPVKPEDNPLVPDEELLVRASSAIAAQPAELLRAAQETTEQKPEELLRAGTKQQA